MWQTRRLIKNKRVRVGLLFDILPHSGSRSKVEQHGALKVPLLQPAMPNARRAAARDTKPPSAPNPPTWALAGGHDALGTYLLGIFVSISCPLSYTPEVVSEVCGFRDE